MFVSFIFQLIDSFDGRGIPIPGPKILTGIYRITQSKNFINYVKSKSPNLSNALEWEFPGDQTYSHDPSFGCLIKYTAIPKRCKDIFVTKKNGMIPYT